MNYDFKKGDRIEHPKDGRGTVQRDSTDGVLYVGYDDGVGRVVEARDVQKTVYANPETSGYPPDHEIQRGLADAQRVLAKLSADASNIILSTSEEIARMRAHVGGVEAENASLKTDIAALKALGGLTTVGPPLQWPAPFPYGAEVEAGHFVGKVRGFAITANGTVLFNVDEALGGALVPLLATELRLKPWRCLVCASPKAGAVAGTCEYGHRQ